MSRQKNEEKYKEKNSGKSNELIGEKGTVRTKTKRQLIWFGIIVLLSGWLGVGLDNLLTDQPAGEETLGMGLWLVLPLLTVIGFRTLGKAGWRDGGFGLQLRKQWIWYIVAFAMFPTVTALIVFFGSATGWIDVSNLNLRILIGVVASMLAIQIVKNFFEEAVWRGFLTAKLLTLKLHDYQLYVIVGLLWGGWHLPYYLFFLPEAQMAAVLPVDKGAFAVIAIVAMTGWSILFVELFRIAGSIWPCVLMHAVEDSLINPLVIDGYITISTGKQWLVSPICGLLTTILYVAAGLTLRYWRIRKEGKLAGVV